MFTFTLQCPNTPPQTIPILFYHGLASISLKKKREKISDGLKKITHALYLQAKSLSTLISKELKMAEPIFEIQCK